MTVTDETLREALARCIVERDNAIGEAIRLHARLDAITSALPPDVLRQCAPYAICLNPQRCAGLSSCPRDPVCVD